MDGGLLNNTIPLANQLTETGWAGVTVVFLMLLVFVWRHFWVRVEKLENVIQEQRESFDTERQEFGKLLDARHEQFILILQESNRTMAAATETNRQEIGLITKTNELLRRVTRSINRCERAQNIKLNEEELDEDDL